MVIINTFQDILLIGFGAVLGANARLIIYRKFEKINLNKNLSILIINTSSSFLLGLFISVLTQISSLNFSYQLFLLFSTGFLGSLSTFSTFIYDIFELFIQLKFFRAFKLSIISSALGIIALAFGCLIVGF